VALQLWLPAALFVAWWAWSIGADDPFFPPVPDILDRFRALWLFDRVPSDVLPSLRNMLAGFAIAAVAGVVGGLVLARIRLVRETLRPVVFFLNAIPPIALIPIAIVLLGFGAGTRVAVIAFSAVFATLIATTDGVRSLDPTLEEVSRVYALRRRERLLHVILPAAAPRIFAGLRVSLQVALIVMISSEMLASTEGIGFLTIQAQQSFAVTDVWAGMLLLGVIGIVLNLAFVVVERRVLRWYHGMRAVARVG
jgi:ABC-type nitrate/sulfonate/bicarbonate transport system permease component